MNKMSNLEILKMYNFIVCKSLFTKLLFVLLLCASNQIVFAHGTVTSPASRVWNCYQENPESPDSPPCIDAVASHGTQPLYDWNGILQGNANGNHMDVVPDGNLASGGNPQKYGGMDQVRSDWVATPVSAGPFTVTWTNSAPHATEYYDVYITTEDWSPDQPLTWNKLVLLVRTDPSPPASSVDIPVTLPNRTGHHVIYSVWQRSDSPEAFYSVSDIDFGNSPPPPPQSKKVIINDDLDVNQSALIKNDLTVDSTLRVGNQFIQALNPELTFQSGTDSKFKLTYEESLDKFTIEEVGNGVALEIKDGEIYLPQYASGIGKLLSIDANGKIVDEAKPLKRFNKYNFSLIEPFQNYSLASLGIHFLNGTILSGLNVFLLDNNSQTGDDTNSVTVSLVRRSKNSNALPDELIFQLTGDNTPIDIFSSFSSNSVITVGSEVIDNDNYIYFVEISYCDECDFREVIILE